MPTYTIVKDVNAPFADYLVNNVAGLAGVPVPGSDHDRCAFRMRIDPTQFVLYVDPSLTAFDDEAAVISAADTYIAGEMLELCRDCFMKQADDASERKRQEYVTPGDAQAMTYIKKDAELDVVEATGATVTDTPILWAEAVAQGTPATQTDVNNYATTNWAPKRNEFKNIASQVEAARVPAKGAIGVATTEAEMQTALDNLKTALDGLPAPI